MNVVGVCQIQTLLSSHNRSIYHDTLDYTLPGLCEQLRAHTLDIET